MLFSSQGREQVVFVPSRWKILPCRHNTTCSRVCMIARNVRRDSFGMGEPRGMLDL